MEPALSWPKLAESSIWAAPSRTEMAMAISTALA
jgi:hypothetical protein